MQPTHTHPDCDLLVIGGGINGAGVARDAALRGLRVTLVEQHDFASGSSSRTSKLVHGGLRYLEQGDLRLVWEACHERRIQLQQAPHLVRPLSFVMPVFRDSRVGRLRLHLGMWLYDMMAAFRNVQRHRMLSLGTLRQALPELRHNGLRAAAQYWDAAMDDARLTLENVLAAREAGAAVHSRTRVDQLWMQGALVCGAHVTDLETGETRRIGARHTIVCTGVWSEELLGELNDGPLVAPTRGTHIVTRRFTDQAWTLTAPSDGRVFFVLPWLGMNLIGTTDIDAATPPDEPQPDESEIVTLLGDAAHHFPDAGLQRADVVSAFAGLRPLAHAEGATTGRSREHTILSPAPGLHALVGGKYTTYRAVAEQLVDLVARTHPACRPCTTATTPLPGGALSWSPQEHWQRSGGYARAIEALQADGVCERTARHWVETYGALSVRLAQRVHDDPSLLQPLCNDLPHTEAEVLHAIHHEMARHLDDWYLRRTRIAFQPCHGLDSLSRVAQLFARELGWSAERLQEETTAMRQRLENVRVSDPHATRRSA